ncbi:MAG: nucleotidyltransferase domain-containing protein [Eggerthellaceae bacterium]|nr:nucleotidyltransferase domain-containing protein [Eggerthellaceae bacterium]
MLTTTQIRETVARVAEDFNASYPDEKISKVFLFGSYAKQAATDGSDVDLLVEFESAFVSYLSFGYLLTKLEEALEVPVDIVPSPLPEHSIITAETRIPLYEQD